MSEVMDGLGWVEMAGVDGLALQIRSNKLVASSSIFQQH